MKSERIVFANNLRGIAAMMVVFAHYTIHFWGMRPLAAQLTFSKELSITEHPTPYLFTLLDFGNIFEWGSIGVGIFFIISGFVISFSLQRSSIRGFINGRIFRILPTYIAGFSITLAGIYLTSMIFDVNFNIPTKDIFIHFIPGIRDLAGSRNIDGVIWTLEIEVKFYALCALLIVLFRKGSRLLLLVPLLITVAALLMSKCIIPVAPYPIFTASPFFLSFFNIMFIGVALNLCYQEKISYSVAVFFSCLYLILFYTILNQSIYSQLTWMTQSMVWSACVFILCMRIPLINHESKLLSFMASISYPLYAIHAVLGYCIISILIHYGVPSTTSVAITFLFSLTLATIIHNCIETKITYRRFLSLLNWNRSIIK